MFSSLLTTCLSLTVLLASRTNAQNELRISPADGNPHAAWFSASSSSFMACEVGSVSASDICVSSGAMTTNPVSAGADDSDFVIHHSTDGDVLRVVRANGKILACGYMDVCGSSEVQALDVRQSAFAEMAFSVNDDNGNTIFGLDVNGNVWGCGGRNLCELEDVNAPQPQSYPYTVRGIGGGGAMGSISISPYNDLWFVATDMGTVFRSVDRGVNWQPIPHRQLTYSSMLPNLCYMGFNPDGVTTFYAREGVNPKRSIDSGVHWAEIDVPLQSTERIRYFSSDSMNGLYVFAGTTMGLYRSSNRGATFSRVVSGSEATGTFIDYSTTPHTVYHADEDRIYISTDGGATFSTYYNPPQGGIISFAGGRDEATFHWTLAYLSYDRDIDCASDAWSGSQSCKFGTVQVMRDGGSWQNTTQSGGDFLRMAENDPLTIWVTAPDRQPLAKGTRVWKSLDGGDSFDLTFFQLDWENGYSLWPTLEYSAVGLDIGYWDGGYSSTGINLRNSDEFGGTGWFFLHTSKDTGDTWQSAFTHFADTGPITTERYWSSAGLEMTSVYKLRVHPANPNIIFAGMADVNGMVSDNGGVRWRFVRAHHNSNYDYALDPNDPDRFFIAAGNAHDFPHGGWASPTTTLGGGNIFRSTDFGYTFDTMTYGEFQVQYTSIVRDDARTTIYAGSQGLGIARSVDDGVTWEWFNNGIVGPTIVIGQMEIDDSGNVYALVVGDISTFNNVDRTGIYYLAAGTTTWSHLRGTINLPPYFGSDAAWYFPTSFAVDPTNNNVLWICDQENHGQWLSTGVWKSTDRGATWNFMQQFTHPFRLTIDPNDPDIVYVGGSYEPDGTWGNGGSMWTEDGGQTWYTNEELPLQANLLGQVIDPTDPTKIIYHFFGGGMMHGPRPTTSQSTPVPTPPPQPLPGPVPSAPIPAPPVPSAPVPAPPVPGDEPTPEPTALPTQAPLPVGSGFSNCVANWAFDDPNEIYDFAILNANNVDIYGGNLVFSRPSCGGSMTSSLLQTNVGFASGQVLVAEWDYEVDSGDTSSYNSDLFFGFGGPTLAGSSTSQPLLSGDFVSIEVATFFTASDSYVYIYLNDGSVTIGYGSVVVNNLSGRVRLTRQPNGDVTGEYKPTGGSWAALASGGVAHIDGEVTVFAGFFHRWHCDHPSVGVIDVTAGSGGVPCNYL